MKQATHQVIKTIYILTEESCLNIPAMIGITRCRIKEILENSATEIPHLIKGWDFLFPIFSSVRDQFDSF